MKFRYVLGVFFAGALLAGALLYTSNEPKLGGGTGTLNQLSQWITSGGYVKTASSTAKLWVPGLSSSDECIKTDATGKTYTGACGSGGSLSGGNPGALTYWTSGSAVGATSSPTVGYVTATSTTPSRLPYASSTAISATTFYGALIGNALTATALGANGSNCSAGNAPLGVDASGAVESCFDVWTEAENTSAAYITSSALTPYLTLAAFYATTTQDIAEGGSNLYYTDARVSTYLTGGTGIEEAAGTVTFDCSEVEGTGINCATEAITLDATGDWTGTFDGQQGTYYLDFTNLTVSNGEVTPNMVWATGQTDEYCLTYEATGSTWEYQVCGTGGGGSISGWATTTSSVAGQLNLYPTNSTDILNVGGSATTSSEFWVDPNTVTAQLNGSNGTSSMVMGSVNNEWVLGTSNSDKSFRIASSTWLLDGATAALTLSKAGVLTVSNASTTYSTATTFFGSLTGTASLATALASNGANCTVTGAFPLGVDASGAAENCTQAILASTTTLPLITSVGTDAATTTAEGNFAADAFGIVGKFFASATQIWTTLTMVFTNGLTVSGGTVDMSAATVKQHRYPSFSWPAGVANATTTTATTTIPIGTAYVANTWNSAECWSGSGTIGYRVTDGTNAMDFRQATTTVSRYSLSTNNTFTASEKRFIEVGPITGSYISCSFDITEN